MSQDKRQHSRYDALNLLYYELPGDRQPVAQGMGRTLNVSHSGILLETHASIEAGDVVMLTIGFEEDLVDVRGEAIHSEPTADGRYATGIHFERMDAAARSVLDRYIEAFQQG